MAGARTGHAIPLVAGPTSVRGTETTTQTINANNADVSTLLGFSVNAAAGNGITITGDGALSYTDTNASPLTAANVALYVRSGGDVGGTPGSVTIDTNGVLTGGSYGIFARNFGTGAVTVTANGNGNVTGTSNDGIYARNYGTDLSVTTGAGTMVSGGDRGIIANNDGTGALTITANGDVAGTSRSGIYARNSGTNLSVTAAGTVSGTFGIAARNYGSEALTIAANGAVTGAGGFGIFARNNAAGTDLSVTTATGTVRGATDGIYARNLGRGALTITANGDVTGTTSSGIFANNSVTGTDLGVTTGAGTTVSGTSGILARNYGTGALTVTANGVTGTTGYGIFARNFNGTDLSVTTGAGTTVSGNSNGIYARNSGAGALTITANGDVTGTTSRGIDARNDAGTALSVTTGTTVSGTVGIDARNAGTGALTITANGDVTGTSSNGIYARNINGTGLSVTTGAGTTVSGTVGINARNFGTGALTVTANGGVTGTSTSGIYARNATGTDLSVTTGAGGTVSGSYGIFARNLGTGATTVTANGDVTGTSDVGIVARNAATGTDLSVTTAAGKMVSGATYGIQVSTYGTGATTITANGTVTGATGINITNAASTVTVGAAGVVTGSGGTAIRFANATNRLELVIGAAVNGNVLGGTGTDTLGLSGTGPGSFNVAQLSSFEAGQKTGTGAWTLTGTNAGITAFSVGGGTLAVNGSLSNAAFTVNGGTLSGTGTVGNTTIASGGTLAPGNSIGTLTVNGNLTFNAGSSYNIEVDPSSSDRTNVTGVAALAGTVNASFAAGSYVARQYTILNATAGVTGTFGAQVNTNLPSGFSSSLSYDGNNAYLNLTLSFVAPPGTGLNANQNNVGNALIHYFNTNGSIPMVYGGLTANGLSQAAGQPGAATAQSGITATGQFVNAIFDSAFDDGPDQGGAIGFAQSDADEASAYAPKKKTKVAREAADAFAKAMPVKAVTPSFAARWNVWASVYGGNARVNGDAGAGTSATTSRIFGMAVGATYRFTPDTQAGFALGGAGSRFDLEGGLGGGRADIFNAAVYARHTMGAAYVAGLLGYSWQDTTTDRNVLTDQLRGSFNAQALAARLEGGWRYATPMVGVTPYAAVQTTTFYLPSYGETVVSGPGTFALNYAANTVTATRGELGVKFDKAMLVQGGVFTLKARTAWAHDWNTDRSAIATFQALPGATFTVNGAQPSANAALASLGAEMKWHNGWSLAGSFDGEFSRTTASYSGKGSLRYAW